MATVGTASKVTWLPNTLTVSPAHSFRKSGWRHSLPPNTGRFYPCECTTQLDSRSYQP